MEPAAVNDDTTIALPIRNLISIIGATGLAVWSYFGVAERLNKLENQAVITNLDVEKNSEFRIRWPRGEIGSLPADAEQYMLIKNLESRLGKLQEMIESGEAPHDQKQGLTLGFLEGRIVSLEESVGKIKDTQVELVHSVKASKPQ